eukprot:CAMPEP_0197673124 /NCGR_PEP_ID=MMETSP1338-20131121/80400_1 /TAXON_ID=43686 ORGANISM="Pelagodinium beii, Strain RCC1491" /NCGR_SAMPLE_ID=MMETSP1338 /ASSEMBLY_ACC=CAM_ASM_000754 /LENGTH=112 /DNA_ID=CAMNT_0043253335 /DNA_START=43 /DNA_END=378 /DNA_ORIENTATION=-
MALSLAEEEGLEPQLAMKLGPWSCFCLCVERGTLDAGQSLALTTAAVWGTKGRGPTGRQYSEDIEANGGDYDYFPPAQLQEPSDRRPLLTQGRSESSPKASSLSQRSLSSSS